MRWFRKRFRGGEGTPFAAQEMYRNTHGAWGVRYANPPPQIEYITTPCCTISKLAKLSRVPHFIQLGKNGRLQAHTHTFEFGIVRENDQQPVILNTKSTCPKAVGSYSNHPGSSSIFVNLCMHLISEILQGQLLRRDILIINRCPVPHAIVQYETFIDGRERVKAHESIRRQEDLHFDASNPEESRSRLTWRHCTMNDVPSFLRELLQ